MKVDTTNQKMNFYAVDEWVGKEQGLPITQFISQAYMGDPVISMPWTGGSTVNQYRFLVDDDLGVILEATASTVTCRDITTGATLWIHNFPSLNGIYHWFTTPIFWVSNKKALILRSNTGLGQFIYYDRNTGTNLFTGKVNPFSIGTYDCVHGLIITIQSDAKVRVWYPKGIPYYFDGPNISTPVYQNRVYTVTATLLGENDEPCEGWWLNWRLLNGKGHLIYEHTITDADGVASNMYVAPTSDLQLGSEEITVEVVT